MKIVGIDLGSKVMALSLLQTTQRGGPDFLRSYVLRPGDDIPLRHRIHYMDEELGHLLSGQYASDMIAVEEPWLRGAKIGIWANNVLWRMYGHIEAIAMAYGIECRLVRIDDWRKTNGIRSRYRKDLKAEAKHMARLLFNKEFSEDEAEATLIARHVALTL